jgi:hypothetical protein
MSKPKRLTPTQWYWLRSVADGQDPTRYLRGRSQHGGATGTRCSLIKRGFLSGDMGNGKITDSGLAALENEELLP